MKKSFITLISVLCLVGGFSLASNYSAEQKDAYNYAYSQKITTVSPIEKANLGGSLTRIAMAKMISNFAINVLGIVPDRSLNCSFADVTEEMDAGYGYGVKKACQLGLMGVGSNGNLSINFNPKGTVTRGQWATVFSRALNKYNGDTVKEQSPYYKVHLEYLHSKGIVKNVENPTAKSVEKRGNVMLMMYRVPQKVKNYEEPNLVGGFENIDESKINPTSESENLKNTESKQIVYHRVDNSYSQFLTDDFNAVEDVYKNIRKGDRVIFLVRHSERTCASEGGWLTERGIELAKDTGKKLRGNPFEDTSFDFYGSSAVNRTVQTSYYVGEGRGSKMLTKSLDDQSWSEYDLVNHFSGVVDVVYPYYYSDGLSYSSIENLYEENKVTVNDRSLKMVNQLCELTDGYQFSWISTHDLVIIPFTEWATKESISYVQTNSEWANYMQGIVIVVHVDGGWEVYPVRSLETGKMKGRENPSC